MIFAIITLLATFTTFAASAVKHPVLDVNWENKPYQISFIDKWYYDTMYYIKMASDKEFGFNPHILEFDYEKVMIKMDELCENLHPDYYKRHNLYELIECALRHVNLKEDVVFKFTDLIHKDIYTTEQLLKLLDEGPFMCIIGDETYTIIGGKKNPFKTSVDLKYKKVLDDTFSIINVTMTGKTALHTITIKFRGLKYYFSDEL